MLREEIKTALVASMKEHNEAKTSTLRLINAAIKDKDIDARLKGNMDGIDDAGILSVLQSMIKQRKDSIQMYTQGNRQDLIDKEQAEIDIINSFLPKQLSAEEVKQVVQKAITQVGASSVKDMGKVMGVLKQEYAGKMDFSVASQTIKELLGA